MESRYEVPSLNEDGLPLGVVSTGSILERREEVLEIHGITSISKESMRASVELEGWHVHDFLLDFSMATDPLLCSLT